MPDASKSSNRPCSSASASRANRCALSLTAGERDCRARITSLCPRYCQLRSSLKCRHNRPCHASGFIPLAARARFRTASRPGGSPPMVDWGDTPENRDSRDTVHTIHTGSFRSRGVIRPTLLQGSLPVRHRHGSCLPSLIAPTSWSHAWRRVAG